MGFFGQYRREKNPRALIEAFLRANFSRPARLTVQGAAAGAADQADFDKLLEDFKDRPNLRFINRPLIGPEWQAALLGLDALIIPYGPARFLWHWSAMLFSAIGYGRPVLASSNVNPEVLRRFGLGLSFDQAAPGDFQKVLERFVNNFENDWPGYQAGLKAALDYFSPARLAARLEELAKS